MSLLTVLTLWLGTSTLAVYNLTRRPRAWFAEPVPATAWAKLEEVRLETRDHHDIGAWFVQGRPEGISLIILHGNKGSRSSSIRQAESLAPEGYTFLMLSLRCHGDSSGDYHDIGFSARQDLIAAVDYLEKRRPGRPIIVLGSSLGAATACFASKELGHRVQGYILESPYQDLKTAVWHRTDTYLPHLIHPIAYAGLRIVGPMFLPHLDDISPLKAIDGIPKDIPVLILAGDADPLARPIEAQALFNRVKAQGQLVYFSSSEHAPMFRMDRQEFLRRVNDFCKRSVHTTS